MQYTGATRNFQGATNGSKRRRHAPAVRTQDPAELHEHLSVGLQGIGDHKLAWAVVSAAHGPELDAGDAGALEEHDIGGAVTPDAARVAVEVPGGNLTEGVDERAVSGDVSRLVGEEYPRLCRQVYGSDLACDLLRILLGQVTDVEVVGAAVRDAVYDVAADDPGHVDARVRKELAPLLGERRS